MRNLTIIALGVVAAGLYPNASWALHKVSITGTHSRGELKGKCDAVGGSCGNCGGTKGSYGCDNPNAGTSISCTSGGKCTGWVPRRVPPGRSLGGILTAPTAGVKETGGGQVSTKKFAAPTSAVKGLPGSNQLGDHQPSGHATRH